MSLNELSAAIEVLDRFDEAWVNGQRPWIEDYLPSQEEMPRSSRGQMIVELVKIDLEHRWRSASASGATPHDFPARPRVEDYLPLLSKNEVVDELLGELIGEEYRVRCCWGERPAHEEFLTRFPLHEEAIRFALAKLDETSRSTNSHPRRSRNANSTFSASPTEPAPLVLEEPLIGANQDFGEYQVLNELGRGGMGVVYRAIHLKSNHIVAIKTLLCNRDAAFHELARFRVEAEAMACLQHPNIVTIFEVGIVAGYPYLVMEYAARASLMTLMQLGSIDLRLIVEILRTLALAVHHAHGRGMIHRDLKPANVLVMEDGSLKISDFGLVKFSAPIRKVHNACIAPAFDMSELDIELQRFARESEHSYGRQIPARNEELLLETVELCAKRTRLFDGGEKVGVVRTFVDQAMQQRQTDHACAWGRLYNLTESGASIGTPGYMSPEQARGELQLIGRQTDVYALGVILYQLLTGSLPFSGANFLEMLAQIQYAPPIPPKQAKPDIPAKLEAICLRCLEKIPGKRFVSAAELAKALDDVIADLNTHQNQPDLPRNQSNPAFAAEIASSPQQPASKTRTWIRWPFPWR